MKFNIINRDVTQNPHDVFQLVAEYKSGRISKSDYISFDAALAGFMDQAKMFTNDDLAQLAAFYVVKMNWKKREAVYIVELCLEEA